MTTASLRAALSLERPLVTPLAHDALSARLIERAGFRAFAIGGSAMLAARYALPDIGLIGLADMVAGIRDIAGATGLPFLADGDDGYGDTKNVARTIEAYELAGAGAVILEDQEREHKQQRAERAREVADETVIAAKLRTALATRRSPELLVIGRTDAYGVLGLEAAIRRGRRFLDLGVDGVFVAGLRTRDDYERVARALEGALLSAAVFEGADTPWLSPHELGEMGYGHVSFPATVITRAVDAMAAALGELRAYAVGEAPMEPSPESAAARRVLDEAVRLDRWLRHAAT